MFSKKDDNGIMYPGSSQVIEPMGEVITKAKNQEIILNPEISLSFLNLIRDKYPFIKDK